MNTDEPIGNCTYVIDHRDRIISVSDSWLLFARENQAGESCRPEVIVNRSIWDFIDGLETRQFYEIILKTVRTKKKTVTLPFRCDAPDKRRYLELSITPLAEEQIEFSSHVACEELRETVAIFELNIPRSDELVKMCSMCKKVALAENRWVEVEAAVVSLKLFEKTEMPRISHGLCSDCFAVGKAELDRFCAQNSRKRPDRTGSKG